MRLTDVQPLCYAVAPESFLISKDFKGNLRAWSYVWKFLDERNFDNAFWKMPKRIWRIGSFEDGQNPKTGPAFH